jgi:hypothetical protein
MLLPRIGQPLTRLAALLLHWQRHSIADCMGACQMPVGRIMTRCMIKIAIAYLSTLVAFAAIDSVFCILKF